MLQQTFLHLPGVGEATEKKWWKQGRTDWSSVLASSCRDDWREILEASQMALASRQWTYFDSALSNVHKWRIWDELGTHALFVDIETDGGTDPDSITVIGTFDGRQTRSFVKDENLQDAVEYMEQFPLLVSFNGVFFDLPVLRKRFPHRLQNHFHLDLRFPLQRLGLTGGLKNIERQLGIVRSDSTTGLTGWDAVRLWREWRYGSGAALEVLLKYNAEDVRNLLPLAELVYTRSRAQLPLP
ncbi:MAG: ribonuclease H-like domain-containing protein [Kiritimatiellae bacterium]|nr:ribonuclease H-like domain-containing protein [Kiritimatiellia bacterium]